MRVYSYVIDHDVGFAPNPFHGYCTLAACKPDIRRTAQLGDYIVGTESTTKKRGRRLIYWMRVDERTDFNGYWSDPRFAKKRPRMSGSLMQAHGDNIYHSDADGELVQEDSFHSQPHGVQDLPNYNRDTGKTHNVLVSRTFAYYGAAARPIPDEFADFVKKGQAHLCRFPPERATAFVQWLLGDPFRGIFAEPSDWPATVAVQRAKLAA